MDTQTNLQPLMTSSLYNSPSGVAAISKSVFEISFSAGFFKTCNTSVDKRA